VGNCVGFLEGVSVGVVVGLVVGLSVGGAIRPPEELKSKITSLLNEPPLKISFPFRMPLKPPSPYLQHMPSCVIEGGGSKTKG
jgi:hypothetical protein